MIVCVCRGLTDKRLRAAIISGSLRQCLKQHTGDMKLCGSCTLDIEELRKRILDEQSRAR